MTKQELVEQTKAAMRSGVHDISVEEIVEKAWNAALDEVEKRLPIEYRKDWIKPWKYPVSSAAMSQWNELRSQVLQIIKDLRHE